MLTRPFLSIGIAIAAGAVLSQPLDPSLRILLIAAATLFLVHPRAIREPHAVRVCVVVALAAGICSAQLHRYTAPAAVRPHLTRVACTVLEASQAADSAAYTCRADDGVTFAVTGTQAPQTASRVLIRGHVEPFDAPRNPGEPDERQIEEEKGIDARIAGARTLQYLPPGAVNLPVALARMHAWALQQLQLRMADPYAAIAAGELWGARASLSPELRNEFQETGTVHILVTAGLHLGVIAAITMLLARAGGAHRVAACALTVTVLWAYAIFSGLHLPSVRAALMISFGIAAYAAGRAPGSWNAFAFALGTFSLLRPQSTVSASFALSFSCVGAILLLGEQLNTALETVALPHRVREALVLTIATQAGTWPLTSAIFLLVAPYACIANLLVVPVVGLTMICSGVQLLCAPIPTLAQACANVDSWLLAWIVSAVHTISSLPYAKLAISPPTPLRIALYDGALIAAAGLARRGALARAAALFIGGVLLVLAPPISAPHTLRITVLDVGQADGIVVQTPAGHVMLVDAGGRLERGSGSTSSAENVGDRIVVPFLLRRRVHNINAVILSHPHGDHAGGVAPVLRAFQAGEFADSGQTYGGYAYNDALQTARLRHVVMVYPRAGTVWRTPDGVSLQFIGPSLPFIESNNTINDNSVAFILQYKQFRMLFTGDAGVAAEQRFLNEGVDLHADVLKVGHHGSAYSSSPAFIAAVHPEFAIVSVGRHNVFGHPAPSTLQTLHRFGARVYRTDQDGAVTIETDGTREHTGISTMLPPPRDPMRAEPRSRYSECFSVHNELATC